MRPELPELNSREELVAYLDSYTTDVNARLGIFLGYPTTATTFDVIYERQPCEQFASASVIKLLIHYALYAEFDDELEVLNEIRTPVPKNHVGGSGVLHLFENTSPTLEDLSRAMIAISDNTATNELIDVLGWNRINAAADTLGMSETALRRKMMVTLEETDLDQTNGPDLPDDLPANVTSPRDCAQFFADSVHRETLSSSAYDRLSVPLRHQKYKHMFPKYFPYETEIAHKTGSLPTTALDTGVLYAEKPLVFSVFVDQVDHGSDGTDIIGEIGDAVYTVLQ